jgi:hypothetical protein
VGIVLAADDVSSEVNDSLTGDDAKFGVNVLLAAVALRFWSNVLASVTLRCEM